MAQLIVRNIEKSVVQELRQKAAQEGISAEEAHRRILRDALNGEPAPGKSFKNSLLKLSGALSHPLAKKRAKDLPRKLEL